MRVHEAKDFLVAQVTTQAQVENVDLSDLEKRMMYFTEGEDAVEDPAALNSEFEAHYDTDAYEAKIARLLKNAWRRLKSEDQEKARTWESSIRELRKGDHYILVLWRLQPSSEHPTRETLMYVGVGVGLALLIFLGIVLSTWIHDK